MSEPWSANGDYPQCGMYAELTTDTGLCRRCQDNFTPAKEHGPEFKPEARHVCLECAAKDVRIAGLEHVIQRWEDDAAMQRAEKLEKE